MKKTVFINILVLAGVAFAWWRPELEEHGRYLMPLFHRFEPDPLQVSSNPACLSYDAVPVERWAVVDFDLGVVFIHETINGTEIYAPRAVSIDSFLTWMQWDIGELKKVLFKGQRTKGKQLKVEVELPPELQGFIGTGGAGLSVNGSYKITLSGRSEWSDREAFYGSKWPQLQMEQESNFRITGTIGSKIKVQVDQDSKRETDLENTINIKYTGEEDDVVQSIEAGNTTLSLTGPTLIGYSERIQGLFGIKGIFQIGDWNITAIASQEKSNVQSVTVRPTTQSTRDDIPDYDYQRLTYFWLGEEYTDWNPDGDSIVFFRAYYAGSQTSSDPNSVFGYAFVNPPDSEVDPGSEIGDTIQAGYFVRINEMDYYLDRTGCWFRLNNPVGSSDILAVRYIVRHADGTMDTVGFVGSDSTLYLRMIKPSSLQPDHPCWEYEWRNVYNLGSSDIRLEETFIKLFWRNGTDTLQTLPDNANVFLISLFGMDSVKLNGDPGSDGYVDQTTRFIDASRGELIFPVPHPFDPGSLDVALMPSLADFPDSLRNPAIYTSTRSSDWERFSHCYLYVETKGHSTTINLGAYNIVPGSEVVKLNGEKLKKDVDYKIYYEIGQIVFLSDKARDPNANIEITFEAQPFFSMLQKTLLGARAKYELGDESWFGITGLYKGVSTPERRPRVGGEPSQSFVWDVDLNLTQELPFLTRAIDAIPLIQTDAASKAVLKLETAQLLSNPNTLGKAYVDDFEGSKTYDPISIVRTAWTLGTIPYGYSENPRAKVIWYNPYDKVPVREIWPNRDVTSEQSTQDVLTIEYYDTTANSPDTTAWGGIIHYINPAYQGQENSQYLEIWVKGDVGVLHIDLGKMSEDIDGDGELDTEDKLVGGRRDNILAPDEDTGIDGIPNDQELDYYLVLAGVDTSGMSESEKRDTFRVLYPNRDPDDPSGDNWSYDDPRDYSHINGTEGNIHDPIAVRKPDTEDLDRNGVLDLSNDYFEYDIDLSSTHFEVPGTRSGYGWRLYRIPLQDTTFTFVEDGRVWHRKEIGNPDLAQIKYIRLWLSGVDQPQTTVQIAQMSFVRNSWEEDFEHFEVAVKNSQEDLDYYPPPGVGGERNPTTGQEIAEHSLVLKYKYLPPLDTVYAIKTLSQDRAEDYTNYRRMTLWINYRNTSGEEQSAPQFIFRMGDNQGNYYEYISTPLDTGWTEHNKMVIDFDELTAFKEAFQRSLEDSTIPDMDSLMPTGDGRGYYRVHGNPSLTNITMFQMGVINPDRNFPISGEVWCDELVVDDVRSENGRAYRGEFNLQAADFASFNASVEQRDDDFHSISQRSTSSPYYHSTRTSSPRSKKLTQNYAANFALGKFFPLRAGVNIPLSLSYQDQVEIPRFKTNSDVFLPDSLREQEKTVTRTWKASMMGVGINPQNPSPPVALLVVPNRLSYSWSRMRKHSPTYPVDNSSNYMIRHDYKLTPDREAGKIVLRKARKDSTGKESGGEISVRIVPNTVSFSTTVNETKTYKVNSYGTITDDFRRTLHHEDKIQFKPLKTLTADYSMTIDRDIHMPDWFQFGPPTILGKPQRKTVNDGVHWQPMRIKWLQQRYDLTSAYTEDTKSSTGLAFGRVSQNRTFKADYTVKWKELLGKSGRGRSGGTSVQRSRKKKFGAGSIVGNMENLRVSYQWNGRLQLPNLARRPGRLFQLGLTSDPGVPEVDTLVGTLKPSESYTNRVDASTGYKFPRDITMKIKYNYTISKTINTSQTTSTHEQTFPDLSFRWGFFKKLKFIKKFANSASANSKWSHKWSKSFTGDSLNSITTSNRLNPLFGVKFNMKGGWTLDLRFNWENQVQETYTGVNISYSGNDKKTFEATARYSIRAQKGLKIPLLGKIKLENTLNLMATVSYSTNTVESWTSADATRAKSVDRAKFSFKPQVTYNLSRSAVAGIQIEISEDKDKIIDSTTHIRDVRIWVQFQFGQGRSLSPGRFPGSWGR